MSIAAIVTKQYVLYVLAEKESLGDLEGGKTEQ